MKKLSLVDYKQEKDNNNDNTNIMDDINNIISIKDKEIQSLAERHEADIEALCAMIVEREQLVTEMEGSVLDLDDKCKVLGILSFLIIIIITHIIIIKK